MISQSIKIFNLPWYGVSHMNIKIVDFTVKSHGFLYEIWVWVIGNILGNMEFGVIDECGMKWELIGKDKLNRKGELIWREKLCVLQNNYCICCAGSECLCNEWIEHEKNKGSLIFPRPSFGEIYMMQKLTTGHVHLLTFKENLSGKQGN